MGYGETSTFRNYLRITGWQRTGRTKKAMVLETVMPNPSRVSTEITREEDLLKETDWLCSRFPIPLRTRPLARQLAPFPSLREDGASHPTTKSFSSLMLTPWVTSLLTTDNNWENVNTVERETQKPVFTAKLGASQTATKWTRHIQSTAAFKARSALQ